MTPEEVSAIIARDLEAHRDFQWVGSRPLKECLCEPVLKRFGLGRGAKR